MQPTAQAVGIFVKEQASPEEAKEMPASLQVNILRGIKRIAGRQIA
jgi:hypothetical protein